jgi:Arc/MetJ family transcription regulator
MRVNIVIDDKLMAQAQKLTNIKNKNIVVDNALRLYVSIENQKKLISLWGRIKVDEKYYQYIGGV